MNRHIEDALDKYYADQKLRQLAEKLLAAKEAERAAGKKPTTPKIPSSVSEFKKLTAPQMKFLLEHHADEINKLFERERRRAERAQAKRQAEADEQAENMAADFQKRTGGQ